MNLSSIEHSLTRKATQFRTNNVSADQLKTWERVPNKVARYFMFIQFLIQVMVNVSLKLFVKVFITFPNDIGFQNIGLKSTLSSVMYIRNYEVVVIFN